MRTILIAVILALCFVPPVWAQTPQEWTFSFEAPVGQNHEVTNFMTSDDCDTMRATIQASGLVAYSCIATPFAEPIYGFPFYASGKWNLSVGYATMDDCVASRAFETRQTQSCTFGFTMLVIDQPPAPLDIVVPLSTPPPVK